MSEFKKGDRVRLVNTCAPVGLVDYVSEDKWTVKVAWPGLVNTHPADSLIRCDTEVPTATTRKVRTRSTTLTTAEELINGERATTYGDPAENFGRIADLWNAQFGHKLSAKFTASDVALALVHLKLSRLAVTPDHADSWVDGCGYLALGSELAT